MGPLADAELRARLDTPQVRKYRDAVDRRSAHEKLSRQAEPNAPVLPPATRGRPAGRAAEPDDGVSVAEVLNSPLARTVANALTRGLVGALLGNRRRRRG
jgi:hypothetical protein